MTIVKQNIQDLIENWLKQEQDGVQFPVNFDVAYKVAGYKYKGHAKRKLEARKSPLVEGEDYLSQSKRWTAQGRSSDSIFLTIKGFILFLINSSTPEARQIVLNMFSVLSGMAMGTIPKDEGFSGTQGFVYLIKADTLNLYKVGMSKTPYKRMATLQTSMPYELTVISRIFSFDCPKLEKALHGYYAAYWMRGEWFDFPTEVVSEFEEVATSLDQQLEVKQLPEEANCE